MNELEGLKLIANDIFAPFEKYQKGECSYDRALEDAGLIFKEHADKRPIVGYVGSGRIRDLLYKIYNKKKVDGEKSFTFNVEVNQADIDLIERILKS